MSDQNMFDLQYFYKHLKTDHLGREFVYKRTTMSTMDDALQLAKSGALHGTLVMAEYQTKARGFRGHTFNALNTRNIYSSFVLHRPLLEETNKGYTGLLNPEICTALAARRAVDEMGLNSVKIKWPNDLWVRGHKLGGFLTEPSEYVLPDSNPQLGLYILGIGLNINSDIRRDPSLGPIATSVACELGGKNVNREILLAKLCNYLEINLHESQEDIHKECLQYSLFHPGDAIFVHEEHLGFTYNAEIIEIQKNWTVLVKKSDGKEQEILPAQLVSLRPKTSQTVVVVHRGETIDGCCKAILDVLHCLVDKATTSVKFINATQLETGEWQKDTQVLVVDQNEDIKHSEWKENIAETVRAFVKDGGAILCIAHATELSTIWFPELELKVVSVRTNAMDALSLVPDELFSSADNVMHGFVGRSERKYFNNSSRESILAWYSQDKKPAIVSSVYGKGIICLCGIHIESVHSSPGSTLSSIFDTELFKRDMLLQNILATCGLKSN